MARLMRCHYCGTLQDEPQGAKICTQCGGDLAYALGAWGGQAEGYLQAQVELDQIAAPGGQPVERHLVLTVKSPDRLAPEERASEQAGRGAMHFVAVLDVSGSMRGTKIAAARAAVLQAAQRLHDGDLFSLVTFSTDVRCTLAAKPVNAGMRAVIASAILEIEAGGQTALCGGLEEGIAQALAAPRTTNLVLVLSDGQANVGETDIEQVGRRALDVRGRGITVSALGIGSDYNEALMAEIALDGGGRFYHIERDDRLAAYLTGELGEMVSLAARGVSVMLQLPPGAGIGAFSTAYPVQGQEVLLGDLPLSTTLEVVITVRLPPQPAGSRLPIDSTLHYMSPAGRAFSVALNQVTLRFERDAAFAPAVGAVKPVVRRVLDQMQAAGVLATSKAAAQGHSQARARSQVELERMRSYAVLLGEEDRDSEEWLSESERMLGQMAAPAPGAAAKAATHAAMRKQRGSKDFGNA